MVETEPLQYCMKISIEGPNEHFYIFGTVKIPKLLPIILKYKSI